MDKLLKVLKIAGLVAGVVAAGVLLGWLGSRGGAHNLKTSAVSGSSAGGTPESGAPAGKTPSPAVSQGQPNLPQRPEGGSGNSAAVPAPGATATATNLLVNWEDRMEQIIGSDAKEEEKAKQLLQMFPRLPVEGQAEVAQHLCNLTADEAYAPLGQYLTNAATPESVLEVLMMDLLNRPNSLKLPYLLGIAREEQNPKAEEAKDLLELFLDENYGSDWTKWQAKMEDWLKENPD